MFLFQNFKEAFQRLSNCAKHNQILLQNNRKKANKRKLILSPTFKGYFVAYVKRITQESL